jgi:hypothetical protein
MYQQGININECKKFIKILSNQNDNSINLARIVQFKELINIAEILLPKEVEFKKLSFSEKLIFWDKNELDFQCWGYEVGKNEKDTFKRLSIFPENKEEREILFHWSKPKIAERYPYDCDFEKLKDNYFFKIQNNPQRLNYTKIEIERSKKLADHFLKSLSDSNSFKIGFESIINCQEINFDPNPIPLGDIHGIIQGITYAYYIPFLEDQLIILEEEKKKPKQVVKQKDIKGIKNWDAKTRAYFLSEIGFWKLAFFNEVGVNKRELILSNILNIHPDTSADYYGKIDRIVSDEIKKEVTDFIKTFKK